MNMNKEDVLTWLITFGREWVGVAKLHEVYTDNKVRDLIEFWDKLSDWHDGAYVTKRNNIQNYEKVYKDSSIEEYRLTDKAINSLNE